MSDGIFDRNLYGKCETKQALRQNLGPGQYMLQKFAHEVEINSDKCNHNANAAISHTHDSIGRRTDIESDLKVMVRLTDCDGDKHKPCTVNCSTSSCNPGVPANPAVCERDIVPTNMTMPTHRGF